MRRLYLEKLLKWVNNHKRKPLIMRGARQVGKTWLVRQLAIEAGLELIELNFEKNPEQVKFFNSNNVQEILNLIEVSPSFGKKIVPGKHLLFLDEIQVYPELLAKLRWFSEDLPQLAVIAAGSLLDFVLDEHDFSMPVGRVEYFYIKPMSFKEFLYAKNHTKSVKFLEDYSINKEMPDIFHQELCGLFREYIHVGGMPEAVSTWVTENSLLEVNKVQHNLINTYRDDFNKYVKRLDKERLEEVLRAIPLLLGKKFKYTQVNKNVQPKSIKQAVDLLNKAQVCNLVKQSAATGLPLQTDDQKKYKVILLDVGLVNSLLGLTWDSGQNIEEVIFNNEGALAEQVAGQLLLCLLPEYQEPQLYYWLRENASANAEVDYLIQYQNKVIPIEVKAGSTGTLRSLHNLMHIRQLKQAVRFNMNKPLMTEIETSIYDGSNVKYNLLSIPFYLIECLPNLLDSIH